MSEVQYPNDIQRFYYEELKWCGCGSPDEVLAFMRDILQMYHDRSEDNRNRDENAAQRWNDHSTRINAALPGYLGMSYVYMLTALDLLEHGGSIGGSWLTLDGEAVLKLLKSCDLEAAMDEQYSG